MESSTDVNPSEAIAPQAVQPESPVQSVKAFPAKTTGEKWFDRIRFITGEGFILGLTAVLAYVAKYGKPSYGKLPNYLMQFDKWMEKTILNKTFIGKLEHGPRIAGAVASTTTLMHGGNLFVPVMKALQDHKQHIVDYINARWGKEGELEQGKERLKSQEKESWGDIIKGRLGSWAVVFASLLGADLIIGKKKGTADFWTDRFQDKFGRVVAGVTKEGREIAKTPLSQSLTAAEAKNKPYLFGKILALDIFATTAALVIWTTISKFSAAMRKRKLLHGTTEELVPDVSNIDSHTISAARDSQIEGTFASRLGERPKDYRTRAENASLNQAVSFP